MLNRMDRCVQRGESFAFETTLSGRTYAQRIRKWKSQEYHVQLVFLWLPSADMAVNRVSKRVAEGGHNVPEHVVQRRFASGLENLEQIYKPLVNEWRIYDNSGTVPQLMDSGVNS